MSFLSRWFGSSLPLDKIRKAASQERWADVLSYSSDMDDRSLSASDQVQLHDLVDAAAEKLAEINLEEGLASLRADDFRRGMEHLDLARQLVRSSALRELIDAEFVRVGEKNNHDLTGDVQPPLAPQVKKSCASSCCGTSAAATVSPPDLAGGFDEATRFELILTSYPVDLRPRYLELATLMRQAILLAHEEKGEEALGLFLKIPGNERNDLYFYELGSLYARSNQYSDAVKALQQTLSLNPGHVLAALTLVDLHMINKNYPAAENLLSQMLAAKCMSDFCLARFSVIYQAKGDSAKAFQYATEALALGHNDPELMVFVARTLESQGRIDEAEGVLSSIPVGGGCSGGANVELADFWLRHKKNLQKTLEMFKKAAQGDPTNPIWGYRIAQVYLALGWKKEGRQILKTFIASDLTDESLRQDAIQLLIQHA